MGRRETSAAALALFVLPACVGVTATLPSTAKPGAAGYMAAFLSRGRGEGFALKVVESTTGRDYVLEFEHQGETGARPQMIEVPPGTYRIASWATFNEFRGRLGGEEIPATHLLGRPFTIGAGQVVLLGALEATTTIVQEPNSVPAKFWHTWEVVPKRMTESDAVARLRDAFPAFGRAPVTCLLCRAEGEPEPQPPPKRDGLQLTPPTLERQPPKLRIGG